MRRDIIELKGIIWEDTINYKKISTTLIFPKCSFKCDKESGINICQNRELAAAPVQSVSVDNLIKQYINNPISQAIVLQGLEPLDSPIDVYTVAAALKDVNCKDDFVIYTGYNKHEVSSLLIHTIRSLVPGKLIIKWGRYIPNQKKHYDEVLGVYLASDNQYGEVIR